LQIVSSSYTAAAYLSSIGFGRSLQPGKHVLLLGSQGTADELAAAGLQVLDAEQLQLPVLDSVDTMLQMQVCSPHHARLSGWLQ
jgi:ribonucleotide monophosphatase NagD (HAD superfamily)